MTTSENLERALRSQLGAVRLGADFDARVLARIGSLTGMLRDPVAARRHAEAQYAERREALVRQRRGQVRGAVLLAAALLLLAIWLAPLIGQLTSSAGSLLARPLPLGLNLGALLVLLPLVVWFAVRQPSMDSRW